MYTVVIYKEGRKPTLQYLITLLKERETLKELQRDILPWKNLRHIKGIPDGNIPFKSGFAEQIYMIENGRELKKFVSYSLGLRMFLPLGSRCRS